MSLSASGSGVGHLGDAVVNRMGYGAMRLTGATPFGVGSPGDRDLAVRLLRRAVELGVNHLDTAAFYASSRDSANELIKTALWPYPDEVVIATKVRPDRFATGTQPSTAPGSLRRQVDENLRQLGRDCLDLVYLRVVDDFSLDEDFAALSLMQDIGLIRYLGVSGVTEQQLNDASGIARVVAVQNRYGVGVRRDDAVLEATAATSIAFVPFFSVAAEGRHHGPPAEEPPDVLAVAEAHGATPAQVRIAWTLQLGANVLAIPGTGNLEHLEENMAAGQLELSPEEMARLGAVAPAQDM